MNPGLKVIVPATISNLACGFDVLGMAIDVVCDEMIGRLSDKPGIHIAEITGRKKEISLAPRQNTAGVAATSLLEHLGMQDRGIELRIHKHIPAGSGLGSSAASAVAAVIVTNELLGRPLDRRALIPFALEGEGSSAGAKHGDNVVPAMLGGLMVIRDVETLDFQRVYTPPGLFVAVILPDVFVPTKSSRSILHTDVPLASMVKQTANLAGLIIGMQQSDMALISRSLEDHVIEPQRKHLIPHFDEIKTLASDMGALGCSISGAGPAVFALCAEKSQAADLVKAMKAVYEKRNVDALAFSGGVNKEGAKVM